MTHNEYTHLTAEELCERLNECWRRTHRGNIRVRYAGSGHYYQDGTGHTFHARRKELEESLRRFQARFDREEAERPAKEAAARETARRRALELAAEAMLATLKSIDGRYKTGDVTMGDDLYRYLCATIAEAEGRSP